MPQQPTVYAEDVNYFQTSQKSTDTWIDDAIEEIQGVKGKVIGYAFGAEAGRSAFVMEFMIDTERFKVVWPVLPSKTGKERAAKIQAATALYHDVKAKCVSAKFIGVRAAFMAYLMFPDGRTVSQVSSDELARMTPALLMPATVKVERE